MSATQTPTDEEVATGQPIDESRPTRPRRRRRIQAAAIAVVLIAAGTGVVVADPLGDQKEDSSTDTFAPTELATVTKGTLSARTLENGALGYAGSYEVINKAEGTVTKVPGKGDVIRQGEALYWVDGKPVIMLYGSRDPVYRALSQGKEGADVRQLNAALVALDYATKDQIDPDSDYFGWQTYYALKEMQDDLGLEETGKLPLGQVVFMPVKEVRVTEVSAVRGTTAARDGAVMKTSSTQREVTVELNASQQADVAVGDKVTITLPNNNTTEGVVSSVGKVASKSDNGTTVDIKIKPSDPKATGQLDKAPVQVAIVSDTVKDALSVPVNALLALAGGGYAVEVVKADGTHPLIPVKPGLFDNSAGKVEVTGEGLKVGQKIVVPAS